MGIKHKIFSYFDSRQDLRVLFIFDGLGMLMNEIESDETEWPQDYVFYRFEGDWFTTKVRLAREWKDKKVVLLFNQNEPSDADGCLAFPLMNILVANMVFHEEDAIAFMQKRGIPMQYTDFFTRHISELLRDKYDKVLSPYYHGSVFNMDTACRGVLSVYLNSSKMLDWYQIIAQILILCVQEDKNKMATFISRFSMNSKVDSADIKNALVMKLAELTGDTSDDLSLQRLVRAVEIIKYNAITQQLATSDTDPYRQLKIQNNLRLQQINSMLQSIAENNKLYESFAPAFETMGEKIQETKLVEIYGVDADFCHVSEKLAGIIIDRVVDEQLYSNPSYVNTKLNSIAEKNNYGSQLMSKIHFLQHVSQFYESLNAVGTLRLNTPDLYIEKYVEQLYRLDMYYRLSVCSYAALEVGARSGNLEQIKLKLDTDYASVTNEFNTEWIRCLNEFGSGFRSITNIERQEDFFKNNFGDGPKCKTVVIVSDAFRYEMAKELITRLLEKKHVATLTASLSMLPTETKYTKTALLPHSSLAFENGQMLVDGKVLSTVEQRTAHLNQYVENSICVNYDYLMSLDKKDKREIFKNKLVYVFHNTMDENCHGCNLKTFASTSKDVIDELFQIIGFIHDGANVTEIYLCSDHGFLYNDMLFEEKDKIMVAEETNEKKTRYFLSDNTHTEFGISKFPLSHVSGMSGDVTVGVPTGTNRFAKEGGDYQFAHGGASLQELVIPVLHSKYKEVNSKQKVSVSLLENNLTISSSRMKAHLVQGEAVSMDMQELTVNCAIYVDDVPVTQIKTITLNSTSAEMGASRIYEVDLTVTKLANSKIMQFKVYKQDDALNPVIVKNIVNNTLIEQDDF